MTINKKQTPRTTTRAGEQSRALHASQPEKSFSLRAFVDDLWEHRRQMRDLYTIAELVNIYWSWVGSEHPTTKDLRSRMGRELRRVGAHQLPKGRRKTHGDEHRTMSQVWYLRSVVPTHLAMASVGEIVAEYDRSCVVYRDQVEVVRVVQELRPMLLPELKKVT